MAIDPSGPQSNPGAKAGPFRCNCCKSSFVAPTDPSWSFFTGLFCWFLAFLVFAVFGTPGVREVHVVALAALGFLFFGLIVAGVAYVFSSVLSSPRCPDCRSTNFARPDLPQPTQPKAAQPKVYDLG